tara:strand:- start:233 stop:754 length:522 start_codon:yes stop_codon:yes gene_type:complete
MNEFDKTYMEVIDSLKHGNRPRIQISDALCELINNNLNNDISIEESLCILCHLRSPSRGFHESLVNTLKNNIYNKFELTSFLMEACQRHFIEYQTQSGNPVPPIFMKALGDYLKNCPKKELIWVLQLIEFTGGKSIFFKKIIKELNWGFSSIFSKVDRQSIEVIKRIEKSWPN